MERNKKIMAIKVVLQALVKFFTPTEQEKLKRLKEKLGVYEDERDRRKSS